MTAAARRQPSWTALLFCSLLAAQFLANFVPARSSSPSRNRVAARAVRTECDIDADQLQLAAASASTSIDWSDLDLDASRADVQPPVRLQAVSVIGDTRPASLVVPALPGRSPPRA